jgi:transaldolase
MNPLVELQKYGQSFWYDNIRRGLIASGELKRMVGEDGLRGMTSNPSIFEKAISGSNDYDRQVRELAARGLFVPEIRARLAISEARGDPARNRGASDPPSPAPPRRGGGKEA